MTDIKCLQCPESLRAMTAKPGVFCKRCGYTHAFPDRPTLTGLYWGEAAKRRAAEDAAKPRKRARGQA